MPTPGASHNRKAGSQIPCARRDRDNKADLGRPMDTHGSAAQPSLVQRNPPRPDSSPAPARTSSATRRTAGDPDPAELDQQSLGTLDRDPHSGSGRGRVNPRPSWTGSPSCRGPSRARASTATSSRGFVCSPTRGRFRPASAGPSPRFEVTDRCRHAAQPSRTDGISRSAWLPTGREPRPVVNAGPQCWKACRGPPLKNSNLLSSAMLTCANATGDGCGLSRCRDLAQFLVTKQTASRTRACTPEKRAPWRSGPAPGAARRFRTRRQAGSAGALVDQRTS